MDVIKTVLQDGEMEKSNVDEIIVVGGSTHIPKIQQHIKDFFKFNGKVSLLFLYLIVISKLYCIVPKLNQTVCFTFHI